MKSVQLQSGKVVLVGLVLVAVGMAVAIYVYETRRQEKLRAAAEAEQKTTLAQQRAKLDEERRALQAKAAQAQRVDALQDALKKFDDLLARWEDATRVAGTTGRISLSAPVATLQSVRRDAQALLVPNCLEGGHAALVEGMGLTVDGYLAFMANTDKLGEVRAVAKFSDAKPLFDRYKAERAACPSAEGPKVS